VDEAVDVIEALVLLTEDDDCVADGVHSVAGRVKLLGLAYTTQFFSQLASPEVRDVSQHREPPVSPYGNSPARLSLQLPAWPSKSVQRMMMLLPRELLAQ
jgi:hypothetical protein